MNKSLFIHKDLKDEVEERLQGITFNQYINNLIRADLKKRVRMREGKYIKSLDYPKECLKMKKQIQDFIYQIFWRNGLRSPYNVKLMVWHLNNRRKFVDRFEKGNELVKWISELILTVESQNFEEINGKINLKSHDWGLYQNFQHKYGWGDKE